MSVPTAAAPVDVARDRLLGPEGRRLVAALVEGAGGTVRHATPRQVGFDPGRSLSVRFDVDVEWPDGRTGTEGMVLAAGAAVPEGAVVLEGPFGPVGAWRHPNDPGLPGLAAALDPPRVRALLDDLGLPPGPVGLRERSYRPGKRAVVEATAPAGRVFLKVVRPRRAARLQAHHARLAATLPVPPSHGWSPELGIVVLGPLDGPTVRDSLRAGGPGVGAGALLHVLDRLTVADGERRVRSSPTADAAHHAAAVAANLPSEAGRLERLVARLGADAPQPPVPVHGDLHPAQLITRDGALTGLLDLDTVALGSRVDDLAVYTGHLATIALVSERRAHIEAHAAGLLRAFDAVDPVELRRRTAAVVIGLATGPFRTQERGWQEATRARIALAERWAASAERVAGG